MDVSSLLIDTYKRYKKVTVKVVTWLAKSAAKVKNINHLIIKRP